MTAPSLPPMTTRQAKRKNQKSPIKFKYSASQMRRADRVDELDDRRRDLEERGRRRKINKRKRDEQDAKDRESRRKLLKDGKISVEDTWGKVTASQPRLNHFFSRRVTRQQSTLKLSTAKCEKENDSSEVSLKADPLANTGPDPKVDSQDDTLLEKANTQELRQDVDGICDADLLGLLSPVAANIISASASTCLSERSPTGAPEAHCRVERQLTPRPTPTAPFILCAPRLSRSSKMSRQEPSHRDWSSGLAIVTPPARPPRNFVVAGDITAEDFEVLPSSHEVTGDLRAAAYFKDHRPPMRKLSSDEIYYRSEGLTDPEDARLRNDTDIGMTLSSFRRHYDQSKKLDPRHDTSGLDIEEDREAQRLLADLEAVSSSRRTHRGDSPGSEIMDLCDTIMQNGYFSPRAPAPESHELFQDSDTDDSSPKPAKRTKRYHFGESTPGRLGPSPKETGQALHSDHGNSSTPNNFSDTEEDMDFDDGGIDDDTLAALPELSHFPIHSRTTVSSEQGASSGFRTSRCSGRFIDRQVDPVPSPSFTSSSNRKRSFTHPFHATNSFNSIDDDIFLAAEQELIEHSPAQPSTNTLPRSISTTFPNIATRQDQKSCMNQTVSVPNRSAIVDSRFVKPSMPASRLARPAAFTNTSTQLPFSTQDALDEAFLDVEQRAATHGTGEDVSGDQDVPMEDR